MVFKIYDDIIDQQESDFRVCFGGSAGVTFNSVDEFVAGIPEDDGEIDLRINCRGGSVSEGWAIVDALRATGKTIRATIDGKCSSMAVSVLLTASERRAQPHATLHIHKPYFPPYTLADAYNEDDLRRLTQDLEHDTEKMLDWYVERTGADRAELSALMAEDKDIDMDEAQRLGFIHTVVEPKSASERRAEWKNKTNPNKTQNNMDKSTKAGILSAVAKVLGIGKVSIEEGEPVTVIETADNRSFTLYKEEGEPAVGDKAEPDGEYPLEDGRIVVVSEGTVTEIREPEPEEPAADPQEPAGDPEEPENAEGDPAEPAADLEALKAENEALKAENAEKDAKISELEAKVAELEAKVSELEAAAPSEADKAIVEKVNLCGGASWLEEVAQSTYTPAQRKNASVNAEKACQSMDARLESYRAKVRK